MKKLFSLLLALIFAVSLAAGCSVKNGADKIGKAMDATGEAKRDFVNAFFTSNLNGRYTTMRTNVSSAVAMYKPDKENATKTEIGDVVLSYYDYHLGIVPYATENCVDKLMDNIHMNLMVDQYAAITGIWLVPRDASFTKKETTADGAIVYDVKVVCEAYEDETCKYLYDVTYTGEMNTVNEDGAEKVDRIYMTERVESK